ncbi:MAG TPA: alkaline phosphatase, partial [Syntrophales bacterium]|nr:alkaline phosphatase [Syntrophales bacterium]
MDGQKNSSPKGGVSRRDVLKTLGMGAFMAVLPGVSESKVDLDHGMAGRKPQGIIFLVGDGMPLGVIRAMHEISTQGLGNADSHIYSLMKDGRTVASCMGTKSLSSIVTDSAPASAAWSTGAHTANGMLAALPDGTPLKTIMELLKKKGLSTGLVTTTRITHATPAAWVSHNINRDAEDAIAVDYLDFAPDVLLGGGLKHFDPAKRADHRDLFTEFSAAGYDILRNRPDLEGYVSASDKKVLGLFNSSHMSYYVDRINDPVLGNAEPSLAEMTTVALNKLTRNMKGFILQVEAGRIDHASHANDAWGAIMDTMEMDMTLGVIMKYMKWNPNMLLIVTSDHGNSGWGVNGTGPGYNDATIALQKYRPIKASFEVIAPKLKNKTLAEIKDVVENYTTFAITDAEAQIIYDSLQLGYKPYPGDFNYLAETVLGKVLAHSEYGPAGAEIRRCNVGFTSNNHTAEDQIALIHGNRAHQLGVPAFIDNTALFKVMCKFFGIEF